MAWKKDNEQRQKRREAAGPEAWKKDNEQRAKRRKAVGPLARTIDLEAQEKRRKEGGSRSRQKEYRRRTEARRQKRSNMTFEAYSFWTENVLPSDAQLSNFDRDPGSAVAMFRLMAGVPANYLRKPVLPALPLDVQGIIDQFAGVAGHDAPIKVCGVCTVRNVMCDTEVKLYSINHKFIQSLKCNATHIPSNQQRLACLRHVIVDNERYNLDIDGFDENLKQVAVCDDCANALKYTCPRGKIPRQSIAFWDFGIIPARLPKLSLIETLAISRNLVFTSIFHMRAIGGIEQIGLKGHSYVLPIDSVESLTTVVTSLPRKDLRKHVMVGFMGTPTLFSLVRKVAARVGPLSMNPVNIFM